MSLVLRMREGARQEFPKQTAYLFKLNWGDWAVLSRLTATRRGARCSVGWPQEDEEEANR